MNQRTFDTLDWTTIKSEVSRFALTDRGKDSLLALDPIRDRRLLERWQLEVSEALVILQRNNNIPIHTLGDIQYMIEQGKKGMYIRPKQFSTLLSFLDHCNKLKRFMKDKQWMAPTVSLYAESIADLSVLEKEIEGVIRHGEVDDYASKELLKLRKQMNKRRDQMKNRMEQLAKKYASMMQDSRPVNKGDRLTLPIKRENRSKVKGTIVDQSSSGATLFVEPEEITGMQEELQLLKMNEEQEVERVLYRLTALSIDHEYDLNIAVETMHQYDVMFAKAKYSKAILGTEPLYTEAEMELKEARHPLLGKGAVPLTVSLGTHDQALLITGPNTGGKTVALKTVGLLCVMAQSGLRIPAKEGSQVPIFQHVFVDIGDGQSIEENLSTFSSRLVNLIEILQEANDHSLLLLDEIGSGTDPGEGMGIATAILDQLADKGATILATTHYSEMKTYADEKPGFINAAMEFDLDTLKPTYNLIVGTTGKSQAFDIAHKLGLHPEIINHAHEITYQQPSHFQVDAEQLKKKIYTSQVAKNRYSQKQKQLPKQKEDSRFRMGDNVLISSSEEMGIIYKGPDERGNYIVQVKGEKRSYNHKRLKLHIRAEDLYPEDYDFDIIFKSKEYRKINKVMDRKHIEGLSLDEED